MLHKAFAFTSCSNYCICTQVCLGLVRLLQYLMHSPLGSVALLDFQPRQFVMVSGELKLTDLDDASIQEPACQEDSDCLLQFPLRNFTLRCSPSRICEGLNEMRNLYNAYRWVLPTFCLYCLRQIIKKDVVQESGMVGVGSFRTASPLLCLLWLILRHAECQGISCSILISQRELPLCCSCQSFGWIIWIHYFPPQIFFHLPAASSVSPTAKTSHSPNNELHRWVLLWNSSWWTEPGYHSRMEV